MTQVLSCQMHLHKYAEAIFGEHLEILGQICIASKRLMYEDIFDNLAQGYAKLQVQLKLEMV